MAATNKPEPLSPATPHGVATSPALATERSATLGEQFMSSERTPSSSFHLASEQGANATLHAAASGFTPNPGEPHITAAQEDASRAGTPQDATANRLWDPAKGCDAAVKGLRMLNTLRPLLPAVGSALGMVNHGAAQAAAKLLPLLSSELPRFTPEAARAPTPQPAAAAPPPPKFAEILETRYTELASEVQTYQLRAAQMEERTRVLAETVDRLASQQATLGNKNTQLSARVRLLTTAAAIEGILLLALVVAVVVLLAH